MLLARGRSTLSQLSNHTSMNLHQLRHGLAVLNQYNLLFFQEPDHGPAVYEANLEYTYNLVRVGKILEMVETSFGPPAKDVMQSLLSSGQTKIEHLVEAYQGKFGHANGVWKETDDEDFPEFQINGVNGYSHPTKKPETLIKSTAQLNSVLCRLIEAELIDLVSDKTFQSLPDILKTVEKDVTEKFFPAGVKGGKGKIEFQEKVAEGLRKVRDESKTLKRKLEQNGTAAKRRKLFTGIGGNVVNGSHDDEADPALDVRVSPMPGRYIANIIAAGSSHSHQL